MKIQTIAIIVLLLVMSFLLNACSSISSEKIAAFEQVAKTAGMAYAQKQAKTELDNGAISEDEYKLIIDGIDKIKAAK